MILNFLFSLAAEMILWARAKPEYQLDLDLCQRQHTDQILNRSTRLRCGDTGLSVELQRAAMPAHTVSSAHSPLCDGKDLQN